MARALLAPLVLLVALVAGCAGTPPSAEPDGAMDGAPTPGRLVAADFTESGSVVVADGRLSCSPADPLRECEGFLFGVETEGPEDDLQDGLVIKARLSWGLETNSYGFTLTDVEGRVMADSTPQDLTSRTLEMTLVKAGPYYLQVDPLVAVADDFVVEAVFEPAPGAAAQ